jgi:hypothetical protein
LEGDACIRYAAIVLKEGIDPLDDKFRGEIVNANAQVARVEGPEACLDVATDPKNIE